MRFLIMCGETRISCKCKGRAVTGKEVEPTPVTGNKEPLPTMILEGVKELGE
jgi:hypothetical protein